MNVGLGDGFWICLHCVGIFFPFGFCFLSGFGACDASMLPDSKFVLDLIVKSTWVIGKMCFWLLGADTKALSGSTGVGRAERSTRIYLLGHFGMGEYVCEITIHSLLYVWL